MKKWVSLILAVMMMTTMLSLTACESGDGLMSLIPSKVSIVNTWTGTVDMTEQFAGSVDMEIANVVGDVTMTFTDDGEYTVQIDADSLNESFAAALGISSEELLANGYGYNGNMQGGEYSYVDGVLIMDADEAECELTEDTLKITTDDGRVYDLQKEQ